MIVLDENIPEDQCELLRSWRIRFRQIGQDVGRQGMKDEERVIPLLHELQHPAFMTRDVGFFDENKRHANYALVCLAVSRKEAAAFIRRFLASSIQYKSQAARHRCVGERCGSASLAFRR